MNRNKALGLILSMSLTSDRRKRSGNMAALYGKKRCASCEYWSGAVSEYNSRQKRNDRKITVSYY